MTVRMIDKEQLSRGPAWKRKALIDVVETAMGELRRAIFQRTELNQRDKRQLYAYLDARLEIEIEKIKDDKGLFLVY